MNVAQSDSITTGELAKLYRLPVRVVSESFYSNPRLSEIAPVVSGRRLIRRADLPFIEATLRRAGKLSALPSNSHA